MRAVVLCVLTSLAGADAILAQAEGHRILFADSTTISEDDQRMIFEQLEFSVSADGSALEVVDCGTIYVNEVQDVDLNEDGVVEVFVTAGNSCTSGMAGFTIHLFVKDAEGRYAPHLGFPGMLSRVLEASNLGFPDLAIGGPGFCEAVLRWDGATYRFDHNEATEPGGCDGIG